ncbi:MAG: type II toxin-antitoxin system RelE/ParE family toxin [Patescibacteria group bacterium]
MAYRLLVPKNEQKKLDKISLHDRMRILTACAILESDPYRGKQLQGKYKNEYAYRVWPYWIIYCIKKQDAAIVVICIGHFQSVN